MVKSTKTEIMDLFSRTIKDISNSTFMGFVKWNNNRHQILPPFDHLLLLINHEEVVISIKDVWFEIEKIEDSK
jgi:hypothetical protein